MLLHYTFIVQFDGERIFKIGEHLVNIQAKWFIVLYATFALDFCPRRCRTRRISKITCVWQTETVTNRYYVDIGRLMWVYFQLILHCCRPVLTYWLTKSCRRWLTDCWSRTAFCCNIFFFVTAVVYSRYWDFVHGWCEHLFVSELRNEHFTTKKFQTVFLNG